MSFPPPPAPPPPPRPPLPPAAPPAPAPPGARRSGPSRWALALGVVAVLVVVLTAIGLVAGGGDDTDDTAGGAGGGATTSEVPDGAYVTGDGCVALTVPDGWVATVEYPEAGSGFAVDEAEPVERAPDRGQPGVYVELSCPRLDSVGTAGPVDIPGTELTEDEMVALAEGEGRLLAYRYEADDPDDEMASVQVTIDTDGVRCSLSASGTRAAVEEVRAEVDAAIASLTCLGR